MRQMIEIKDENKSLRRLNTIKYFSNILILHHIISYHIMQGNKHASRQASRQVSKQASKRAASQLDRQDGRETDKKAGKKQEQSYLMRHCSWWKKFFLFIYWFVSRVS